MKFLSHSPQETELFAQSIAKKVTPPAVICLIGDLGAGKTAFTRGFARFFGVDSGVSSPTFTIMHQYNGTQTINHYDLYRINDYDELLDIGFDEQIESGINILEWADAFMRYLPEDKICIRISRTGENENERLLEVEGL